MTETETMLIIAHFILSPERYPHVLSPEIDKNRTFNNRTFFRFGPRHVLRFNNVSCCDGECAASGDESSADAKLAAAGGDRGRHRHGAQRRGLWSRVQLSLQRSGTF